MVRIKPGVAVLILLVAFVAGCVGLGKPSPQARMYAVEYPEPAFKGLPPVNEAVRVGRMSSSRVFSGRAILFRTEPFSLAAYPYDYWAATPADMVRDLLARDLRASGLFKAVFARQDYYDARFHLDGEIVEFFEDDTGGPAAVIRLDAVVFDRRGGKDARPLLQKSYRFREPCERSARGVAQGMSRATANLSGRLILDVYHCASGVSAGSAR